MRHSGSMRLVTQNHAAAQVPSQQKPLAPKRQPAAQQKLQQLNNPKAQQRLAKAAAKTVGKKQLRVGKKRYRADCCATVRAIYAKAGIALGGQPLFHGENGVSILYRYVQQHGVVHQQTPLPGDLVFFNATYDRSGTGRFDDPLTHVGIVEKVLQNRTVVFVHRINRCIVRSRMNLQNPRLRRDPQTGVMLNHVLRRDSRAGESATTGQLFAGFGRVKA